MGTYGEHPPLSAGHGEWVLAVVERDVPDGWTAISGVLEPGPRVVDYGARGQPVKGICNARDCRRRVTLDPAELTGQGLGFVPMKAVQRLWKCQRLDGCALHFHEEPATMPLRLSQLVGKPNVRIKVRCQGNSTARGQLTLICGGGHGGRGGPAAETAVNPAA